MGQFSWLDCKTEEQVIDNKTRDVYVLIPAEFGGGHIKEDCYDGYGRFGGHDIYELVVDWNKKYLDRVVENAETWHCDWVRGFYKEDIARLMKGEDIREHVHKRDIGIALACYDEDNERLMYPIKITHDESAVYELCQPSKGDPNQGWEVKDDEDEEDEWW